LTGVTTGFLVYNRFSKNPEQIVPLPYEFTTQSPPVTPEAPILIIGDQMATYLARFKEHLALTISADLSTPIKIQSMARDGDGLHRTIHEMRSLTQWPQILIYQGGSEEFKEAKFKLTENENIQKNFKLYSNEKIQTLIMLYPQLSRLIYRPIDRVKLGEKPEFSSFLPSEYLKRLETELLLYEQQLLELVNLSRDRNTLLILTTTPINLDVLPKSSCNFTSTKELEKEINEIRELLKANNPKNAHLKSSKLVKQFVGNANLYYIHGQTSLRLGLIDEAKKSLLEASSYECSPWRATEVQNSIIRKVAKQQQILLFDFAQLVEREYTNNDTFFDDLHPQNQYYEKAMEQLGLVIKRILKL
jgi:hypothetical protein